MRPSGVDAFLRFTEGFEGGIPYLYDDIRGIVTVAFGNALFSAAEAARLPFMHAGGVPASTAEIIAAYETVHNDKHAPQAGYLYAKTLTTIRLTHEAMSDLALAKMHSNNAELVKQIPDFEEMPACAQLAMHSWAWACGSHADFPHLIAGVRAWDFGRCVTDIHMNEWTKDANGKPILNRGLVPRNIANKILMANAAYVQGAKLDPETLDWVHELAKTEAPTTPELDNPPSDEPLLEEDGGSSRREATLDAAVEAMKDFQRRDE